MGAPGDRLRRRGLARLGVATDAHLSARQQAWDWLLRHPVQNMRWKGYFEDVAPDVRNANREQYTPGEVARYLMRNSTADPAVELHVPALLGWIRDTLGDPDAKWRGATGIREQFYYLQLSSSHTARYGSLNAMWAARGGAAFAEEGRRALALASYFARDDGVVIFSLCDQSVWFSDGYFDYVPHFLDAMAALPELAPPDQDHILGSTSVLTEVAYADGRVEYVAAHADGTEVLRLTFAPGTVLADGVPLPPGAGSFGAGYEFEAAGGVLRVTRTAASRVVVAR